MEMSRTCNILNVQQKYLYINYNYLSNTEKANYKNITYNKLFFE